MSQRGSNCDQLGAKGPKSPAENRQKNDSSLSRSSLKLSAPHSVLTWRVLVAELVPPPWREVAELYELAGLAAAGQGRGGYRGGSGGRRSVAHRASERERENASRLSQAFFFSRVRSNSERAKQERSLSPFQKSLFSPSLPPSFSVQSPSSFSSSKP